MRSHSGNQRLSSKGCADFSANPADRLELLARAVLLVAGLAIPEHDRAAVLARVVAAVPPTRKDS
jgi:hypothetical protein